MKHLTYLFFLLMSFSLYGQEGTTLEEYRYLSKGYLYQKELGLDIHKNGYTVKNIHTTSKDAQLIGLYKDGEKGTKALLVVIEESGQAPVYICIPHGNSNERVMSLYNLDVQRLVNVKTRKMYDNAIQEFLYHALNNSCDDEKTTTTIPVETIRSSYETTDKKIEQMDEVLVSKGGTEAVLLTEADPVKEKSSEDPGLNPTITQAAVTIIGDVRSRNILAAPNVQVQSTKKGTVAVKVCVDMEGYVVSAKFTQRGSTTFDKDLKKLSVDSASKYRFGKSDRREECGIIQFQY